ncbi:acyl carrier protein [Sphingosinicella sp. CPCC 101087]|uniref:acyl carrier protein n=1 Tax=Sphingosinicella sp. CPCC 101087 TaxID=2497754 RepID=UPI00101D859A|nr:acyl carrier protein [Sphingosinicella sp. CPCC 101087]
MEEADARALIPEELAVGVERVVDAAAFQDDLGADSLDLVELTMRFEEAFDITISEEEAIGCATVADALGLLRGKTSLEWAA